MNYDSIHKRIQEGFYKNTLPYPKNHLPIKPRLSKESKYFDLVHDEYKSNLEKHQHKLSVYRAVSARIDKNFSDDVIKMLVSDGLSIKEAEKVFSKAWDMGHSAGFAEVLNYINNFIDLFL